MLATMFVSAASLPLVAKFGFSFAGGGSPVGCMSCGCCLVRVLSWKASCCDGSEARTRLVGDGAADTGEDSGREGDLERFLVRSLCPRYLRELCRLRFKDEDRCRQLRDSCCLWGTFCSTPRLGGDIDRCSLSY